MVSVEAAKLLVKKAIRPLATERIAVENGLGRALSKDIVSPLNLPQFDNSAMDGYAIIHGDSRRLKVVGEIRAGDRQLTQIKTGEAVRIFTGAEVPQTATAVVMQEQTTRDGEFVLIETDAVKKGQNIRTAGAQILKGDTALSAGTELTPAGVSFLAMLGFEEVAVFKKPRVAIVVTGDELIAPGEVLERGQIYESNSFALKSALVEMGITDIKVSRVNDDRQATLKALQSALTAADVLLVSGGISVGDYDFVGDSLRELGVEEVFYKVAQKPGKPLFFGTKENKAIFALPGNPASAMVCFYEYVFPALRQMMGFEKTNLLTIKARLAHELKNRASRACFYRGYVSEGEVKSLEGQASFIMKSFAEANCLIYMPEGTETLSEGEEAEVHLLK